MAPSCALSGQSVHVRQAASVEGNRADHALLAADRREAERQRVLLAQVGQLVEE
jgi:hypothetical protein